MWFWVAVLAKFWVSDNLMNKLRSLKSIMISILFKSGFRLTATYFLLLVQKKVSKEKYTPVKSLIFALFQFSLRQFSKLAALKQTKIA
ncbi:hypothetical protein EUX54_05035 [Haemophilus haemolyticus]|uniref:Uncharacterized protein n=1 Tax=Haemophilus haemolyticus TaxID=726 RepID=A0A502JT72_HAEHA|nr:hypothetical protein EUX54_05035 [Haemophilus haemolyticus]